MTKHVGFCGGSSLRELGPASDAVQFFECVHMYAAKRHVDQDWRLITDRLYRRYLRLEELDVASELMTEIRNIFLALPSSEVSLIGSAPLPPSGITHGTDKLTLHDVFKNYFDEFNYCVESSKIFYQSWKIYKPVKIAISDMPDFILDKKRPLEAYDSLEAPPFWLR